MPLFPSVKPLASAVEAKPFLKWVGGKGQLLAQFEKYFPTNYTRYFEPFVGGGAIFFHLWNTNRLPEEAFLFDNNEELINTYCVVRDELDTLVELLALHQRKHTKEYFYHVRGLDRQDIELTNAERAARTIYLNRTCYNGLYRVNSKNQFNAPMGSYKNPTILYRDVLEVASKALQNVVLRVMDFREILDLAKPGDFFYFDPPYVPISKTASFTSYTKSSFNEKDQYELSEVFRKLTKLGCLCMLSNSYSPLILDLYHGFSINVVKARRAVNSDANGRGSIREVVILNCQ